jgi:hypothetical protein
MGLSHNRINMKKTALLLLFPFLSFGQKVNLHFDTSAGYAYCNIQPTKLPIGDQTIARLSITTFDDNQLNHCQMYYALITTTGDKIYQTNTSLDGENYELWQDKAYLYNYIAKILSVKIID